MAGGFGPETSKCNDPKCKQVVGEYSKSCNSWFSCLERQLLKNGDWVAETLRYVYDLHVVAGSNEDRRWCNVLCCADDIPRTQTAWFSQSEPHLCILGEMIDGVATIRAYAAESTLVRWLTTMLDLQQVRYFCFLGFLLQVISDAYECLLERVLPLVRHMMLARSQTWVCGNCHHQSCMYLFCCSTPVSGRGCNFCRAGRAFGFFHPVYNAGAQLDCMNGIQSGGGHGCSGEGERVLQDWNWSCTFDSRGCKVATKLAVGGQIMFKGAQLQYRLGLPLVLKGLDIVIPAKAKVGVVGWTGSGTFPIPLPVRFVS